MTQPLAIVLSSGGLDSTTVLALALRDGYRPVPLTFRYGQRHFAEVAQAQRVHDALGALADPTVVLDLPYNEIGGSALLGEGEIPEEPAGGAGSGAIPSTYVPGRNLVFLSLAAALAEARGARDVFIGVNSVDYSGYPDCRPEFIASAERTIQIGTREGAEGRPIRIQTPLIHLGKSEIIQLGLRLGVDYSETVSCYDADNEGRACGRCESCGLRRRGFESAGVPDPTRYRT